MGGYAVSVCNQCGVCANMCQVEALARAAGGVVRLNRKTCVGCLVCVGECPSESMHYHDDLPTPFKCVACGLCAKQCPGGALTITDEQVKGPEQ